MANAQLIKGILMPSAETVREMILSLRERMENDKSLKSKYDSDPRKVLGEIGLNYEIQNEVLIEEGRNISLEGVECTGTCACTGCCVTG